MHEPQKRTTRPRKFVLHVTEKTYLTVERIAKARKVSKAAVLREIFNAGVPVVYGKSSETKA